MSEERKLVTVLFADVTGSTALAEDLDPEDVRALMGRYYDHARLVIADHGGTLEKFIGDAVMAVFGLPHAHGDDAERAIAAGLSLRTVIAGDPQLVDVTLRIGINTGEVVATSDASRGDFLITGDAVNVAARLQQYGAPGEILVSERTYDATRLAFFFSESRDVEVKGKRQALRVFPVTRVRSHRQSARPPMVGRADDLMMLSLLHRRTLREQRPQLVSIVAPAGTGKTRLLEEFLAALDPGSVRVATSRCPSYGQTLAYWPLRGLLTELVGDIDRNRVIDGLTAGGYDLQDASRLADLALTTLGIESDVFTERESIFNAWRILIEVLARQAPRIVVFEDLHWASDSLLDLVEHVMHPHTKAPMLVIAISRPELFDRRPAWGAGHQSFTTLVLEPLNAAETEELVERLGTTLPRAIHQRIVDRSGGNPFFATELVRGLTERGVSGKALEASVVPDTVHAAVLARLDALTPIERAVVQAAAVTGRSFRTSTLAALMNDVEPEAIRDALEGLLARDIAMLEDGGAYTFRHVLFRDVAYGTLSRSERIRMHVTVAAWMEEYAADKIDEFVEVIAYHYREAAALSLRSSGSLPLPFDSGHAISIMERAGELASRTGAIAEARDHLEVALALACEADRGRLYEKLGDCSVFSSVTSQAYNDALECWRADVNRNPLVGARILRKLLIAYTRWNVEDGRKSKAHELAGMLEEAQDLAKFAGDEDEIWRLGIASVFVFWIGYTLSTPVAEISQQRQLALDIASYFEERGDWESFSAALDAYIGLSQLLGMHDEVINAAERRLAAPQLTATESGDAHTAATWAHLFQGHYQSCIDFAHDVIQRRRPDDSLIAESGLLTNACGSAYYSGRWHELEDFLRVVEDARTQFRDDRGFTQLTGAYIVSLHLALAREDRPAADLAAAALTRVASPDGAARALLPALLEDDPRKALVDLSLFPLNPEPLATYLAFFSERGQAPPPAILQRAGERAESSKLDMLVRFVNTSQALALQDSARLSSAIDDAEAHDLVPHAARMRIVLAQMTGDPAPLKEARRVLELLDDRQFLRRLNDVASSLR